MAKNIIEFSSATADIVSYANYTSSKTVLGPDIRLFTGSVASEYWIGPPSTRFQDPTQDTGLNSWNDITAVTYSGSKQWVFLLQGVAATPNIPIAAYEFDSETYQYTYKGRTTVTPLNAGNTSVNSIHANLEYYSTGSVQVSGTVVTGTGTNWIANRIPIGARIGFGSTDPAAITTWYRIANYPSMSFKTGFTADPYTVAVDASGSLYVGGNFTAYSGSVANKIVKLTPSGSIDTSFNAGAGFNNQVYSLKFDSSGSLFAVGTFTTYSGSTANRIIKLNTNGTIDTSFNAGGGFNSTTYTIEFDSSGSIYVGGQYTTYSGSNNLNLVRLNPNGTRDATFLATGSTNSSLNGYVGTIAVDSSDNLYVGGNFTATGSAGSTAQYIVKLLKTGVVDTTFALGTTGAGTNGFNNFVTSILYKSASNSIIVVGGFTTWRGAANTALTELSSTGTALISSKAPSGNLMALQAGPDTIFTGQAGLVSKRNINTLNSVNSTTQPTFNPNAVYGSFGLVSGTTIAVNPGRTTLYVTTNSPTIDGGLVAVDTEYGDHIPTFHTTPDYISQVITLNTSAGNIPAGTPYVIENLQFVAAKSSAGFTSLIQGLSWDDFTLAGTTIAQPTANYAALAKGAYSIQDTGYVGTTENDSYFSNAAYVGTAASDAQILPSASANTQYLFMKNTSNVVSRINIKDPRIRLYGNTSTNTIRYCIANQVLQVGAPGFTGNGNGKFAIATMQTGSASGSLSFYGDTSGVTQFNLSTIQNRTVPTATQMLEQPPGSTNTYVAAGNVGRVYYMPRIDKLIVLNASATAKSYITDYRTDLQQPTLSGTLYGRDTFNALALQNSFNLAFLGNFGQLQGNTTNINAPRYPDTLGTGFYGAVNGATMHLCRPLTSIQNNMYAVPIGCEAEFVNFSKNALYTPKYTLTNVVAISGLYVNTLKEYGSGPFILPPEPVYIHYRTTGIDDDSGAWNKYTTIDALNTDLECEGALNNLEIQFRFSYKVAGNTCLPNRIYGFTLVYEDDRTDSHYTPSVAESDLTTRIFAWRQAESWYGNIPELKIRLYNAANNKIVYYDTTATNASGTWQYSTDGTTWFAWNATADAVGNYIRYIADFIPSGIKLRVGLNKI